MNIPHKKHFGRIITILFLMTAILMSGCMKRVARDGNTAPASVSNPAAGSTQSVSAAQTDPSEAAAVNSQESSSTSRRQQAAVNWNQDAVLKDHIETDETLKRYRDEPRYASGCDIYIENTAYMTSFVQENSDGNFSDVIVSVLGLASKYADANVHYLQAGATPQWVDSPLNGSIKSQLRSPGFYEGIRQYGTGLLASGFEKGNTIFGADRLTVIISTLVEPGADLFFLGNGIQNYFDNNAKSAASIAAFQTTLSFAEQMIYNDEKTSSSDFDYTILGFDGNQTFYVIAVGPEASVREWNQEFMKSMNAANQSNLYSNSINLDKYLPVITMDIVEPYTEKTLPPSAVLQSYNVGTVSKLEYGNVFISDYKGSKTYGSAGMDGNITTNRQLATVSTDFDASLEDKYDLEEVSVILYKYSDNGTWTEAGKNEASCVSVTAEVLSGGTETTGFLTSDRRELYISACLDFSDTSYLNSDATYRVQVKLPLNLQNSEPSLAHRVDLSQYDVRLSSFISNLKRLSSGGINNALTWYGSNPDLRSEVADYISRTPGLVTLTDDLGTIESRYRTTDKTVEYIDFVFTSSVPTR